MPAMSRENNQKIQKLEIDFMKIQTDISYIKDSVKQNVLDHKQIIDTMNNFIKSAEKNFVLKADHKETMRLIGETIGGLDEKFAPKIAWNILCWSGGTFGVIFISGLLYLFAKAFLHIGL